MELWIAARTDELRASLLRAEGNLGAALREIFDRFVDVHDVDNARLSFDSLLAMLRGLELTRVMRNDDESANR